jgi:hypothetical protein
MQLAVRLAAILLAITSIAPVAQAATALWDFTLIDGTGRDPVPGSAFSVEGGAAYGVTVVQIPGTHHTMFDIRAGQHKAQPEKARVYTAGQGSFQGSPATRIWPP